MSDSVTSCGGRNFSSVLMSDRFTRVDNVRGLLYRCFVFFKKGSGTVRLFHCQLCLHNKIIPEIYKRIKIPNTTHKPYSMKMYGLLADDTLLLSYLTMNSF